MLITIPPEIHLLWKFASTDTNRSGITNVLIEFNENGITRGVATSGHFLAMQDIHHEIVMPSNQRMLIPATLLKKIQRKTEVILDTDNRSIAVGSIKFMFESDPPELYPLYEKILPHVLIEADKERAQHLNLDGQYLGMFGAHCKQVFGNAGLNFQVPRDSGDPVLVKSLAPDGTGFTGVIMPMRK